MLVVVFRCFQRGSVVKSESVCSTQLIVVPGLGGSVSVLVVVSYGSHHG